LMDALEIDQVVVAGFGWGARTANIIAALWPERCRGLVSVGGYLISSQAANRVPSPPDVEARSWHEYYLATERGDAGYSAHRRELARLMWRSASPSWHFDDATFDCAADAFDNPDHVAIVVGYYRWRLGLSPGERQYDALEAHLAALPEISVPTITLDGDTDLLPHPTQDEYAAKFTGPYAHRTLTGGVGHNLPQEAPVDFADAILDIESLGAP